MEIVVAVISGLCVAIPSVIATLTTHKKSSALMEYKIEELTKKVEKHNNLVERMYNVEKEIEVIKDKIK